MENTTIIILSLVALIYVLYKFNRIFNKITKVAESKLDVMADELEADNNEARLKLKTRLVTTEVVTQHDIDELLAGKGRDTVAPEQTEVPSTTQA